MGNQAGRPGSSNGELFCSTQGKIYILVLIFPWGNRMKEKLIAIIKRKLSDRWDSGWEEKLIEEGWYIDQEYFTSSLCFGMTISTDKT